MSKALTINMSCERISLRKAINHFTKMPKVIPVKLDLKLCYYELNKLFQALQTINLVDLDLSYSCLSHDNCIALTSLLPKIPIKSLDLSNNKITLKNYIHLLKSIKKTKIESLRLAKITIETQKTEAKYTQQRTPITAHKIWGNFISLLISIKIRKLDLSANLLPLSIRRQLYLVLSLAPIQKLNLSHVGINDQDCHALKKLISTLSLKSLNLSDNSITDTGCILLIACLPDSNLQVLSLERNDGITDKSCVEFAKALPLSKVTSLNLLCNDIGSQGCLSLLKVSPKTSLSILQLTNYKFSTPVYRAMLDSSIVHKRTILKLSSANITQSQKTISKKLKFLTHQLTILGNLREYYTTHKITFLMGLNQKYGKESSVYRLGKMNSFERQLLPLIFRMIWPLDASALMKKLNSSKYSPSQWISHATKVLKSTNRYFMNPYIKSIGTQTEKIQLS